MRVSILIPTFNRANYLPRAVESVLAQDYHDIDVIVSDNASTDGTSEVVNRYIDDVRFKYFRNVENLGMVPNWRKALNKYATGDFFMILSDDDYLVDDKYISKALELIKTDPEIVMVFANGYLCYEDSKKMVKLKLPFNTIENGKTIFLSRNKVSPQDFCLCNILFKRSLAINLNAFSNDYNISCDSEIFLKMCLFGKVGLIKDFVSVYQLHSENLFLKLKNSLKLIINNYDSVLEPYKLAKKLNLLSADELEQWEHQVLVFDMTYTLFTVMIFQDENYEKLVEELKEKDLSILMKVQKTPRFKIFLLLYKLRLLKFIYKFNSKIRS